MSSRVWGGVGWLVGCAASWALAPKSCQLQSPVHSYGAHKTMHSIGKNGKTIVNFTYKCTWLMLLSLGLSHNWSNLSFVQDGAALSISATKNSL
jgi:hypothetical protein